MRTFAELYCERYHVSAQRFERALFWRCLHRRAILLAPFVRICGGRFFAADDELIHAVGRLTHPRGLPEDVADFYSHPGNHGFARRRLRLRLSVGRLTHVVHSVFAHAAADASARATSAPVAGSKPDPN